MEFINANLGLVLLIALLVFIAALVWLGVRDVRTRREQRRLYARLHQENEQQQRSILLLNRSMESNGKQMLDVSELIEARQDSMRRTLDERIDALQRSNEYKLEQMREIVTEKLDTRLNESFKVVNSHLADVHRGIGEMRELAGEFGDLKKVLGGVKTRGVWGEMQLRALLEQMLAPSQYIENAAIPEGSQTRVEFAVRLPSLNGETLLPIDSKFPQEDFMRLTEASESGDAASVEACAARLERALELQAKQISDKYIHPPQTADFAVMFLPVESLYAEAVRRNGFCQRLQDKYRVLVAGPNTLAALLTSLRMGFRTCTLEKRSGEVLKLLGEVRLEFARYEEGVTLVRRRLTQVEESLDALDVRARKLNKQLREISEDEL